jgi:hypothetical protein
MLNGSCRPISISAAAFLLLLAPPYGQSGASAGTMTAVWGPIGGLGYYVTYPQAVFLYFATFDGELTIGYDPADLRESFIELSTGRPGYGAAASGLDVVVSADRVTFTGEFELGGEIRASFVGDPGPLDPLGHPESLDPFLGDPVEVVVSPSYHGDQLTFSGRTIPEPSSLLILTIGIGGVWVSRVLGSRMARVRARATARG